VSRRTQAIWLYVAVAYGVTWAVWWPYLRAARGSGAAPGPFLFYLGAYGPFFGAILAAGYERGWRGARDLLKRLVDGRRARWWVVVGLGSPLLLVPLAIVPIGLVTGNWPDWSLAGVSNRAPGLGPLATWLLMTVSYGVGEETGWRGFLLPRLQTRRSALRATLLLVPIWALWHLPAFGFREGYVDLGIGGTIGFLIGLTAGAIVLTALYNASRGSVLVVALWHGTWNWLATADGFQGPWVATMTTIIMVAAPLLIWWWGPAALAPGARATIPVTRQDTRGGIAE
jgi:membrane protease YdiL (CAAX protease family)